ncbi:hypothetical protein [Oceanivirga salmonicida]|uniref:hypothetical protein n=1 Tax=Oceanivirga salmonicida TaxID=1769291 RepID=UPI00082A6AA1|nr:hypothetical protein [Oceanivirga salmonicida]
MQASLSLKIPKYQKYGLLTSESLNILSFNFIDYINNEYINSADGIITGLDISYNAQNNTFNISKGILKYNNKIYWLNDEISIKRSEKEGRYNLILEINEEDDDKYYIKNLNFKFIMLEEYKNEYILFSIILRNGADIYNENNIFNEYRQEYNVIDLTNQKYSCKYSQYQTISPILLKKWAKLLASKTKIDNVDLNIIFLCLNSVVSRECLIEYIRMKLNIEVNVEISNEKILKNLSDILTNNVIRNEENKNDDKKDISNFFVS